MAGSAWQVYNRAGPQPGVKGRILETIAVTPAFPQSPSRCATHWCRGRGSNPYAAFRQAADFHHTAVFTASLCCSCAGLCLHHGADAVGAPRLVSTPSRVRAWLGVASDDGPGGSPNLRGFTQVLSRAWCSIFKSAVSTSFTTPAGASRQIVVVATGGASLVSGALRGQCPGAVAVLPGQHRAGAGRLCRARRPRDDARLVMRQARGRR